MKTLLLITTLLTITSAGVIDITKCRTIKDNNIRVTCYDTATDVIIAMKTIFPGLSKTTSKKNVEEVLVPVEGVSTTAKFKEEGREPYTYINLFLNYKNNTKKKVVGLVTHIKATDVFGKVLCKDTVNKNVNIKPKGSFIDKDPKGYASGYGKNSSCARAMEKPLRQGTIKTEAMVSKIIFSDGTTVGGK